MVVGALHSLRRGRIGGSTLRGVVGGRPRDIVSPRQGKRQVRILLRELDPT